jgi:nitroreductase
VNPRANALPACEVEALSRCMRTLRSVRRFLVAEVDPASIEFVLAHAVLAGSAKNRQPWRFVVVRERPTMAALAAWYRRGWLAMASHVRDCQDTFTRTAAHQAQMRDGEVLARLFDTVPVAVVACFVPAARNPVNFYGGASIYPALQNLLLAARALGLGATMTTVQCCDELGSSTLTDDLRALLRIPADIVPAAVIPLGWPAEPFGEVRRRPVRDATYAERWGHAWPAKPVTHALVGGHHA